MERPAGKPIAFGVLLVVLIVLGVAGLALVQTVIRRPTEKTVQSKPDEVSMARATADALFAAWDRGDSGGEFWDNQGLPVRLFGPVRAEFVTATRVPFEIRLRYRVQSRTQGGLPIEKLRTLVMVRSYGDRWLADRLVDTAEMIVQTPRRLSPLREAWDWCTGPAMVKTKADGTRDDAQLLLCLGVSRYTVDEALAFALSRSGVNADSLTAAADELKKHGFP